MDDALDLLTEWMEWWYQDEDAPAKLPNALQVRTAVKLTTTRGWTPPRDVELGIEVPAPNPEPVN